ncbi:MAG: hypothetical protein JST41_10030 [Bacteroidetes bacterium]|nr:hypothetical protein [Bacteroidota bacterium]MCC6654895.1 hypothetical protein [Flavobacteriales bacterium]HMU12376.1 hypothetical protein [Flavobacteriales bacterium]HNE81661.1 hypothetical protein [Flavobacteriales bacterium]HNI04555.1 hypothetical protein [Flavobacteriales bacterium]
MHTELTPNESLKLIESMIGQAKKSFSRISFYFLLWGALMIAAMLSTYLLRNTDPAWSNGIAWGVAGIVGGIVSFVYGARQSKSEIVTNPMDGIIGQVWISFVITLLIMILCGGLAHRDPGPMITLLTGIPTFLTGRILRFRPLIAGGVIFWVAGIAMHLTSDPMTLTVIYCGSMVFGYIIPGIMLKRQENGLRTA